MHANKMYADIDTLVRPQIEQLHLETGEPQQAHGGRPARGRGTGVGLSKARLFARRFGGRGPWALPT